MSDTSHQHVGGVDPVDEEDSHSRSGSSSRSGPTARVEMKIEKSGEYGLSGTWRCLDEKEEEGTGRPWWRSKDWASEDRR